MTSSGITTFNPSLGEAVLYAFHLCGVRPPQLGQEHMFTARMAANLLQLDWANEGVNLWKVEGPIPITFVQGVPTYSVPGDTIMMLDAYVTQVGAPGATNIDRIITPITRTEYASYPNKLQQSDPPNVYWFDRLISPTVTLWPAPAAQTYTLFNYYRVAQIQDAVLAGGTTLDVVQRFLPAYIYGLAGELAMIWAPSLAAGLKTASGEKLAKAKGQDVERGNVYITPMLSGYYRN